MGVPRLHDADAHVPLGPARADRPFLGPARGDPRPHAFDPPTELWPPERMDRGPWPALHAHPSRRGRPLFLAMRLAHHRLGSGLALAEGHVLLARPREPVRP